MTPIRRRYRRLPRLRTQFGAALERSDMQAGRESGE
jgi:hypothetical protein